MDTKHKHKVGDILRFRYEGGKYLYLEVARIDEGRNNYKVTIIRCMSKTYKKGDTYYFNLPRRETKRISEKELIIGVL